MRRVLAAAATAAALTVAVPATTYAQAPAQTEADDGEDGDNTGLWGLLGLLGLAGLAGLKRRNDPYDRDRTSGTAGSSVR